MSNVIIGTNSKVEVQKTLGSPVSITDVSMNTAGEAVATASNSLSAGDIVVFQVEGGMVQLDGQAARVSSPSGSDFVIEGIDISDFDAWTTGTFTKVESFETLANATNVSLPNASPTELDATTLIDREQQIVYGLEGAIKGTIDTLFKPGGAAEAIIRVASRTNTPIATRISWNGGTAHTVFNGRVKGGSGVDVQTNAIGRAQIAITVVRDLVHYAT